MYCRLNRHNSFMKSKERKQTPVFLYGLTFIAPVAYSVILQELDTLQKLIFSGISLFILLFSITLRKNDDTVNLNKYLAIVLIIFPMSFLTSFFNDSAFALPLLYYSLLVQLCIIILTVLMLTLLGEEKFFKTVSFSVVLFSGMFGLVGLLEVFQIKPLPLPLIIPPGSTLGHRSFAVEYILPALPFIIIIKEYVSKRFHPVLAFCAFINISFILFTRSRSAMIILGVVIIIYFIFLFKTEKQALKKISLTAGLIAASFIFSLIPAEDMQRPDLGESAASLLDPDFRSNRLRMNYWSSSLQMISENPLTGKGLYKWSGCYPQYSPGEFNDKTLNFMQSIHAHNDFLELFAENGIFTPVLYLIIIIITAALLYSKSKTRKDYFFILISVLTTALFSIVAFPFYKFSSSFFLAFSIGVAITCLNGNSFSKIALRQFNLKIIFLVLLLAGLIISIIRLKTEIEYIKSIQFLRAGMYTQMIFQLDKVSDIFYPFDASKQPVDYYRGVVYSYLRNYHAALECNLNALKLAPYSPLILNNVATSYHSLGNTREAISRFESLKKLFPDYIDPQIKLLYLYTYDKQVEKGSTLLNELLKKNPENQTLLELKKQFYPFKN